MIKLFYMNRALSVDPSLVPSTLKTHTCIHAQTHVDLVSWGPTGVQQTYTLSWLRWKGLQPSFLLLLSVHMERNTLHSLSTHNSHYGQVSDREFSCVPDWVQFTDLHDEDKACKLAPWGRAAREGLLMATGTHRVDHGQSEVKLQVWVDEGCHKATTGRIHMDSHVPSILLVQRLCINKARV